MLCSIFSGKRFRYLSNINNLINMIYGCHNDPSLEYINDSLDDVLSKNERYAEESTRYGINRDHIITEFTKSIIKDLHTVISSLREEITR